MFFIKYETIPSISFVCQVAFRVSRSQARYGTCTLYRHRSIANLGSRLLIFSKGPDRLELRGHDHFAGLVDETPFSPNADRRTRSIDEAPFAATFDSS